MCEASPGSSASQAGKIVRARLPALAIERIMERMEWTTPAYEELKMDAEIGSYQQDDELPFAEPSELDPAE
jgi:hypothetical protein